MPEDADLLPWLLKFQYIRILPDASFSRDICEPTAHS